MMRDEGRTMNAIDAMGAIRVDFRTGFKFPQPRFRLNDQRPYRINRFNRMYRTDPK